MHGLPMSDPLANNPLIDLGQSPPPAPKPLSPLPSAAQQTPDCTVICIRH